MKSNLIISGLFLCFAVNLAYEQEINFGTLNQLPRNIKIDKSKPQIYTMITEYFDYDLHANFNKKTRIKGEVTCNFNRDSLKWNNVYVSETNEYKAPFPEGKKQLNFENFKYIQSEQILKQETFSQVPQINIWLKNLVWDMAGFEVFGITYWDSLKLNTEFSNHKLNSQIELAGNGTFENKEIKITWIGVTKINNKLCAIIKYSQMNGKLNVDLENMKIKGRSHYWGEVYVSLSNKQIEYATLTEDVVTDVSIKGQPNNILGYTVRKIELIKTN